MMFKFLKGIGATADNLSTAAWGEHEEWAEIYKDMEKTAREEGFVGIADFFKELCDVEEEHEKRFLALLERVKSETVFKEQAPTQWKCRNCGYVHTGPEAPEVCPVCKHAQSFFERRAENY